MVGGDATVNPDAGNMRMKESRRHWKPTSAPRSCHSSRSHFASFAFCFLIDCY